MGSVYNMFGIMDGSCQDFCFVVLNGVDFSNLFNEANIVLVDVVNVADEWRQVSGVCFGSQDGLIGRKDQCIVGVNVIVVEVVQGFYVVFNYWDFYYDIWCQFGQCFFFFDDVFKISGDYFSIYIIVYNFIDFLVMCVDVVFFCDIFFGYEGRVGCYVIQNI